MLAFLISYKAHPHTDSPHFGEVAGAVCTFWVTSDSKEDAQKRALDFGEKLGWIFTHWQTVAITERSCCGKDATQLERFDRAQRDGISAIFDMFESDTPATN